ncbi:hypothetical protein LLEC1_02112 [Akanthomyces lecanii]|uniref:BTB domain-containing protein n=1 Tax=Cordyceps confragosa TaxID=2714763 RepID=A0A179I3P8_CORDF|nr:hypothetical protein LLEC1_02112 [Akanthomyces lecanii]
MADNDAESMSVRDDASTVEIEIGTTVAASGDVEMEGAAGDETPYEKGPVEDAEASVIQEDPAAETRPSFIEYLSSPVVTLLVGQDAQTVLTAHQALLSKSPYFEQVCQAFIEDGSARSIELPEEDYNAMGSFLEFLYTGDFWAARSHALRAEAEVEFKSLCLEHPQFGYDVLTRVLDDKLKRERNEKMHPATTGSGRKRSRLSQSSH